MEINQSYVTYLYKNNVNDKPTVSLVVIISGFIIYQNSHVAKHQKYLLYRGTRTKNCKTE